MFVETLESPQKKYLCTKGAQTNSEVILYNVVEVVRVKSQTISHKNY